MRLLESVLLLFLSYAASHPHPIPLHIGGLLPLTGSGWPLISPISGQSLLVGAQLAISDINSNSQILPGYRLKLSYRDTKNDPGWAVNGLNHLVSNRPKKLMITGSITSDDSLPVALTTKTYNLVQCLPAVRSPFFANRDKFPRLFIVSSSDGQFYPAMKEFLMDTSCSSKKIGFVYDMDEHLSDQFMKGLHIVLRSEPSLDIVTIQGYRENASTAMEKLKIKDAKVIIISVPSVGSMKVFCEAYKKGLYGPDYTWVWIGFRLYIEELEKMLPGDTDCTFAQIKMIFAKSRYFTYYHEEPGLNDVISSGKTVGDYETRYEQIIGDKSEISTSKSVYDCILASALALNSSMTKLPPGKMLQDFDYQDSDMADVFTQSMQELDFNGLRGRIIFDATGFRIDDTLIGKVTKSMYWISKGIAENTDM